MIAIVGRDLRRNVAGGGATLVVSFFLLVATLFPFAIGPDAALLARVGGGIIWTAALLAGLLPVERLVAPDLEADEERAIVATALAAGIDGLVVANSTLARPAALRSRHRDEAGGLSGAPLLAPATAQLKRLYRLTSGRLPLVGVGGIASGADAYARIRAGASALSAIAVGAGAVLRGATDPSLRRVRVLAGGGAG